MEKKKVLERFGGEFLKEAGGFTPEVGIILGSGLGSVAEKIEAVATVPYSRIRGFPKGVMAGHDGKLVLGRLSGKRVAVMSGRFHSYQGLSMKEITAPVRLLAEMGARVLLVTNAAGGISSGLKPGDLMIIEDHINLIGNPLVGKIDGEGHCFLDMTDAYSHRLQKQLIEASRKEKISLKCGVYLACTGPSYETPAEVRAFKRLGADAVGMSTAPEVVMARSLGMEVCGLSCITNYAAGRNRTALSHEEVLETTRRSQAKVVRVIEGFLKLL